MENNQNTPSVIAKLMGFDETQPQQRPVSRKQHVLSENYLQKSGSIGKRSRTYSSNNLLGSKKRVNRRINYSNKDKDFEQKRSHFDGMRGRNSAIAFDYGNQGEKGKSDMELEDRANCLPTKIVILRPDLASVQNASIPSFLLDSQTTFAWETKKQRLERFKMNKVSQELWFSGSQSHALGEMFSLKNTKSEFGSLIGIESKECWKYKSTTESTRTTRSNSPTSTKMNNLVPNSSTPVDVSSNTDAETEDVESFDGYNEDKCNHSTKEGCVCHLSDHSSEQDSPIRSHEDGSISSNFIEMDEEHPDEKVEAYQCSPNSVLEPPFREDTDLHGLWMQLQLLKSESEENDTSTEMVTPSDDERFSCTDQHVKSMVPFAAKESRDFSYLSDVLDESGFQGSNVEIHFERWHSPETMASPSVFETLEKKYGKQELWHKAERKLLFDSINAGMTEILRPCADINICSKPLRRKMRNVLRRDVIEEELLILLLGQEKGVNDGVSEKAVGRGPWFDPVDELDSLVREIEAFLFDELLAEFGCA